MLLNFGTQLRVEVLIHESRDMKSHLMTIHDLCLKYFFKSSLT